MAGNGWIRPRGWPLAALPSRSCELSAGSHPPRHNQTVRLLVVEDDARMAAALRRGLRYEGIVADVAGLGAEAVGMARATDYDAIVLDVMLPDIDGFETCRRLRARSE